MKSYILKDLREELFKKILLGVCLSIIFWGFNIWNTQNIQAAVEYKAIYTNSTWEIQDRTVGKATFEFVDNALYAVKDGKRRLVVSQRGLCSRILTNGTEVYYNIDDYNKDSSVVYHIASIGNKGKKIFSVKKIEGSFSFEGLRSGKIYYVKGIDPGTFCSYSLHSNKTKVIKKNVTTANQYKQYFCLMPYRGGGPTGWLRVYNADNNKIKMISNNHMDYNIISNHIYFAEINEIYNISTGQYFNIDLIKCNFNGGNKKILIKNLNVQNILQINKQSLKYYDMYGKQKTKKF